MRSLTALELEVLGWLLDDYESPSSITGDISRELGAPQTEAAVAEALTALASLGLAQAYVYDAAASKWRATPLSQVPAGAEPWFLATPAGAAIVNGPAG